MLHGVRDKVERLSEVFNKKSFRRGVLGAVLVGGIVGFSATPFMDFLNAPDKAGYGPRADLTPVLVDAARQQAALQEWKQNWQSVCYVAGQPEQADSTRHTERARQFLERMSRDELVGKQAVNALEQLRTAVCINESDRARSVVYIDATNSLTIRSSLDPSNQLLHVLEEARHAVQKTQGMVGSINTTFEESLRAGFALEADAVATTILAASRMRAQGDFSLWQTLSGSGLYIDLKTRFEGEMLLHGDEMKATRAVFDAWYDHPARLKEVYSDVRTRLQNERMWPVERPYLEKLPSNFFDQLGNLGDGRNYGANKSPRLSQRHVNF